MLLSVGLIEHEVANNNINKAEELTTFEEVEDLAENDGYPYKNGLRKSNRGLKS